MTRAPTALSSAFAVFSGAMLGLSVGALWMLPTAYLQSRLPWLAWPVGALLGWAVARWVTPRKGASLLAAGATLLAAAYVSLLAVTATLAGNMDLGLIEAMRTAGGGMLLSLTWMSLTPSQLLWFVSGAAIAGWVARRTAAR